MRATQWTIAGAIGAVIGVVWNYAVSATLVWRAVI
jgi:dolichol-phosphate mannosyltransferase